MIITQVEHSKTLVRMLKKIGDEYSIGFSRISIPQNSDGVSILDPSHFEGKYMYDLDNGFQVTLYFGLAKKVKVPTPDPVSSFNNEALFEQELREAVRELLAETN